MNSLDLIKRIEELEELVTQLRKEKSDAELLKFPWIGNLGQWYWLVETNEVHFNNKKVTNLGYKISELPDKVGFEFFTSKLHPDDFEYVMNNMRFHLMNKSEAYEVEYRIQSKNGEYVWYYDRGKVVKRDKYGKPTLVSGIVFDISKSKMIEEELKLKNKQLEENLNHDELTGLYNRKFILRKLEEEINRYLRTNSKFSLLMLDIDDFKSVNDRYGHETGDLVLKGVSEFIGKRIRKTDFFCRWGGEEFLILVTDTEKNNAIILAQNIIDGLNSMKFGVAGKITVSIGLSTFKKGDTIHSLLKDVDENMYLAKKSGKNCLKFKR